MINYHGITHHAQLSVMPPAQQIGRLIKQNIIYEQPMTQFKGLTTDMRGRDLQGYAVCKDFQNIQTKSNQENRLVNIAKLDFKEQYPQRKPKTKSGYIPDIRPSELDLLSKMKDDNTKMLIIKLLQAKSIGQDTLRKGSVQQQAKLQIAYDDLRNRYEQVYRDYKGLDVEVELTKLLKPFRESVVAIYGVSLEELNRLNSEIPVAQDALIGKTVDPMKITADDQAEISTKVREQAQRLTEIEEANEKEKEARVAKEIHDIKVQHELEQKYAESKIVRTFTETELTDIIDRLNAMVFELEEIEHGVIDSARGIELRKEIYHLLTTEPANYDDYVDLIKITMAISSPEISSSWFQILQDAVHKLDIHIDTAKKERKTEVAEIRTLFSSTLNKLKEFTKLDGRKTSDTDLRLMIYRKLEETGAIELDPTTSYLSFAEAMKDLAHSDLDTLKNVSIMLEEFIKEIDDRISVLDSRAEKEKHDKKEKDDLDERIRQNEEDERLEALAEAQRVIDQKKEEDDQEVARLEKKKKRQQDKLDREAKEQKEKTEKEADRIAEKKKKKDADIARLKIIETDRKQKERDEKKQETDKSNTLAAKTTRHIAMANRFLQDSNTRYKSLPGDLNDIGNMTKHRSAMYTNLNGQNVVMCFDCSTDPITKLGDIKEFTGYSTHSRGGKHQKNAETRKDSMKQIHGTGVGKVGKVYAGRGTEAQSMSTTMALRSAIAKIVQ